MFYPITSDNIKGCEKYVLPTSLALVYPHPAHKKRSKFLCFIPPTFIKQSKHANDFSGYFSQGWESIKDGDHDKRHN